MSFAGDHGDLSQDGGEGRQGRLSKTQRAVVQEGSIQWGLRPAASQLPEFHRRKPNVNEQWIAVLAIIAGLGVLVLGGEWLVRGASALAARFHIPPLIIGLTVVAFGTSAPELGVSLQAAYAGAADVAVGNIVGSNIFNVLFILGASAMISPLVVSSQLVRFDVPLMIAVSVLSWALARDGVISRLDGAILFAVLVGYILICIRFAGRESKAVREEFAAQYPSDDDVTDTGEVVYAGGPVWRSLLLIVVGLALLGLGSKWLVDGAVNIATWWGVSQLVIGLTIVAAGTSLPEVVTSIVATVRGQRDIAVGNVVGSNIFNLSCVLGLSGIVARGGVPVSPTAVSFDIPVMILVAALCLPIFFTGRTIARWEGVVFFIGYIAYTTYMVLSATSVA